LRKMDWFRLYPEIRRDPKIRRLSPDERWLWIVILCIASDSPERGKLLISEDLPYEVMDISDEAAMSVDTVENGLKRLQKLNLIEQDESGVFYIPKWEDRQYDNPSDTPSATRERKRKSREKQKAVKKESQQSHDDVTNGHDIETEAEAEADTESDTELKDATAASIAPASENESSNPLSEETQDYESFYKAHERIYGFQCNPLQAEKIAQYIDNDRLDERVVIRAMERAALNGTGYSFGLITKILNDYVKEKAFTLQQAIALDNEYDKRRKSGHAANRENNRGHPEAIRNNAPTGGYYDQFPGLVKSV